MPERTQKVAAVARAYQAVCAGADAKKELRALLIGSLETRTADTYHYVQKHPNCTAREISGAFRITINYAGFVLKQLYDVHLVNREVKVTEDGREYYYEVKP